jgi:acid phosphatase type 7
MKPKLFLIILLSFYCQFTFAQIKIVGPYLQMGSPTSVTIRWTTDVKTNSKITFGKAFGLKNLLFKIEDLTNEHIMTIPGLEPNTKYYYSVGNNDKMFTADSTYYFKTLPMVGSKQKIKIVAFGDCGTGTSGQKLLAEQITKRINGEHVDSWLLLGDNAYQDGRKSEFKTNFFDIYEKHLLKNTMLWPSPGNHDYADGNWVAGVGEQMPYYDVFSMPTLGESGGEPSKTEAYYSFDVANVHFVSLDSYGFDKGKVLFDTTAAQIIWLKKDLTKNKLPWTIVFFHHPPYSKGSHDSDNPNNLEVEKLITEIRQNVTPILERFKVDLVLNGHSHSYERSYLMQGYRGKENTFKLAVNAVSNSSGKYDNSVNSCPYIKKDSGTVYIVAGTAGGGGIRAPGYPHDAMVTSDAEKLGGVIFDVEDNRLDLSYITLDGLLTDNFTIFKDVNKTIDKVIECGEVVELKASWNKGFKWSNGKLTNSISIDSLSTNDKPYLYNVKDSFGCLSDQFKVSVKQYPAPTIIANASINQGDSLVLMGKLNAFGLASWEGPNGFKSDKIKVAFPKADVDLSGVYKLTSKYKNCVSTANITAKVTAKVTILLTTEPNNDFGLKVFPNPATNEINIRFKIVKAGNYKVSITDIMGKDVIVSKSKFYYEGLVEQKTNLSFTGNQKMLFVNISGEKTIQTFKVVLN